MFGKDPYSKRKVDKVQVNTNMQAAGSALIRDAGQGAPWATGGDYGHGD